MKQVKCFLVLALGLVLSACSNQGFQSANSTSEPQDPPFAGVITPNPLESLTANVAYTQESCTAKTTTSTKSRIYKESNTVFKVETDTYTSTDCSGTPVTTLSERYETSLITPDLLTPSYQAMGALMLDRYLTLNDNPTVTSANNTSYFGHTDWVVSTPKDIACTKPDNNPNSITEPCVGNGNMFRSKVSSGTRIFINGSYYSSVQPLNLG